MQRWPQSNCDWSRIWPGTEKQYLHVHGCKAFRLTCLTLLDILLQAGSIRNWLRGISERVSGPLCLISSLLASTLPTRLIATIARAQKELGELFHPRYPQVLTHGDLNPLNILISSTSGCITGIIDWAEARVLLFGLALYGLENLLGNMGPGGWKYFEIRDELEKRFWS